MPFPNPDTQFQKGKSGNPAGKAKGTKNTSTLMKEMLEVVLQDQAHPLKSMQIEDMTVQELMVAQWAAEALKDWKAAQAYREAIEGKPVQQTQNLPPPEESPMFDVTGDHKKVSPDESE